MPELKAKFTADDSDIKAKASGLNGMLGGIGRKMAAGFSIAAVTAVAREIAQTADRFRDMADSTGMSTRGIQALEAAAENAGVESSKVEQTINRISQARFEALSDPTGSSAQQFAKLGIALRDLEGMSVEQTIEAIGRAAADAGDDFAKMAAVTELVGIRSKRMVGVLQQLGKNGFEAMADQADKSGAIMSEETINRMDQMGDAVKHGWRTFKAGGASTLSYLGQVVGLSQGQDYTDDNKSLAERSARLRQLRMTDLRNPGYTPEKPKESQVEKALALKASREIERQSMKQMDLTDEIRRIGGGGALMGAAALTVSPGEQAIVSKLEALNQGVQTLNRQVANDEGGRLR